jgi:hypothetical protein
MSLPRRLILVVAVSTITLTSAFSVLIARERNANSARSRSGRFAADRIAPAKTATTPPTNAGSTTEETGPGESIPSNVADDETTPSATEATTSVTSVKSGTPEFHGIHNVSSPSRRGFGWFYFDVTYTGNPPAEPSTGSLVIPEIELQGVYLGSTFASTYASTVTSLESYLDDLVGSSYMSELSPYGVSTGTTVTGEVLNVTLPQYTSSSPTYVTDSDIVNYLATNINNGTLVKPLASTVYVVFTEPGVAVSAGNETSINSFLGYHNDAQITESDGTTTTIYYAVLPYPGSPNPTPASQGFANVMDELTAVTSHEVAESATDPDTVNGWQETVNETVSLNTVWGWVLFKFTFPNSGEEICDVSLLLNNYGSVCYAVLNGYVVQKPIGPDGVTMLTPSGSTVFTPPATTSTTASTKSTKQGPGFLGLHLW